MNLNTNNIPLDEVTINVAGTIFRTTILTLTARSKYFADIFSERYSVIKTIFIDRNPELFKIVLDYLRNEYCFPTDNIDDLVTELEFYQINIPKCLEIDTPKHVEKEDSRVVLVKFTDKSLCIVGFPTNLIPKNLTFVHDAPYSDVLYKVTSGIKHIESYMIDTVHTILNILATNDFELKQQTALATYGSMQTWIKKT